MGKKKRGIKKAVEIIDDIDFEFVDLPQRKMVVIQLDMVEDDQITMNILPEEVPTGSIVKLIQRYRQGDQEQANQVLDEVMKEIRVRAKYVRPPERIIIKEQKAKADKVSDQLTPYQAIDLWFEMKSPSVNKETLVEMMRHYMMFVEVPECRAPVDMSINTVSVLNFMPFKGLQVLEDIPLGLVGVVGRYTGQDGRSNRSGKSAFFDSIQYAFYGEGRKVETIIENAFDGTDTFEVGLGTTFDSEFIPIVRAYRDGRSVLSIKDSNIPVKAGTKEIQSLLGMTQNDFVRTCFVRQGDLETILSRTSSQLKEDIIRWRGLQFWASLEAKCRKDQLELEKGLIRLESRLEIAQESIDVGSPSQEEIDELKEEIKKGNEHNAKVGSIDDKLRLLGVQLEQATAAENFRFIAKGKAKASKLMLKVTEAELSSQQVYNDAYADMESARKEFQEKFDRCADGFDGVCPVDNLECPRTVEINNARDELNRLASKTSDVLDKSRKLAKEAGERWENDRNVLANMQKEMDRIDRAEKAWKEYNGPSVKQAKKEYDEVHSIVTHYVDVEPVQDRLNSLLVQQEEYTKAKANKASIIDQIDELSERLKVMRYFRFMCGKYGIPNVLIEGSLREIESQVNSILEDLGTDHRLEFDTERELRKPAQVCFECGTVFDKSRRIKFCKGCGAVRGPEISDELRPMIVEGGRKQTFDQDSGAGRGLVALATRVAMSRFLGSRILFLDEVSGMLDEYHLGMLIRFLHKLPDMGFTQVFVITHEQEVEDALQSKIYVTRYQEETRSTISQVQ